MSQRRSGKPYRNYTHSRNGLRSILQASGISRTSFFVPFPNYRTPDRIVSDLDKPQLWEALHALAEDKTGYPIRHLAKVGLSGLMASIFSGLAPAYYVVAQKD